MSKWSTGDRDSLKRFGLPFLSFPSLGATFGFLFL
jgi:hypothetical protein